MSKSCGFDIEYLNGDIGFYNILLPSLIVYSKLSNIYLVLYSSFD